jgi:glycosyltransferase involved in cell wall biosynthesis
MTIMEQILSYFTFDIVGIIGISTIGLIALIQIYFYLFYYKKPISYFKKQENKNEEIENLPPVSVIIIAKNESENLEENLPLILAQNYPNFEVIVVNDGSTDESHNLLERLSKADPRLYHTFSPDSEDKDSDRRKVLSMTIGIKAARNEILLFTEAGSKPLSNNWISSMVKELKDDKEIVLGYSLFDIKNTSWSKVAIFDNLIFSLQYFSMAIKSMPFGGTYRNIVYKKHLFFDNKGFSATLNYDNAEEIFLNRIMTSTNTTVSLSEDSFISTKIENFSHWKNIKMIYCKAKSHFERFTPKRFSIETFTRYLFYISVLATLIYSAIAFLWVYLSVAILIFLIRYIIQLIILKKSAQHFQMSPMYLLLPIMDIVQPLYNFNFNRLSKKRRKRRRKK